MALCFLSFSSLFAQERTIFNDIDLDMTGAWGGWQYLYSDYDGQDGLMRGGYGGLEFHKKWFLGYGAMRLRDDISLPGVEPGRFDLRFHGPSLQYMAMPRSIIHPKFAMQLGFGKANVTNEPTDRILLLQPSVGAEVNVLRWFRLSAEGGYRYAANWDLPVPQSDYLNNFFAQVTLKFGFSWGNTSWDDDDEEDRPKRENDNGINSKSSSGKSSGKSRARSQL